MKYYSVCRKTAIGDWIHVVSVDTLDNARDIALRISGSEIRLYRDHRLQGYYESYTKFRKLVPVRFDVYWRSLHNLPCH